MRPLFSIYYNEFQMYYKDLSEKIKATEMKQKKKMKLTNFTIRKNLVSVRVKKKFQD